MAKKGYYVVMGFRLLGRNCCDYWNGKRWGYKDQAYLYKSLRGAERMAHRLDRYYGCVQVIEARGSKK